MPTTRTIFVTGATGTVGSGAVKALRGRAGVSVRAGVRSPEKARALAGGNVTPVPFDFADQDGWPDALRGADAVLLITPAAPGQVAVAKAFVDAAQKAGVRRVVRLSVIFAGADPGIALGRDHRDVENYLRASGLDWVFLRPNSYMQNFYHHYKPDENGRIYLATGNGASSFVDAVDVGAAAAAALTAPDHAGLTYDLTGPEALTTGEVARILSDVSGRDIQHVDIPEAVARQAMIGAGVPAGFVEALLELHAFMRAGAGAPVAAGVEQLTGRRPRRFAEFARENAAAWKQ